MRTTILIVGTAVLLNTVSGCALNKRKLLTIQYISNQNEMCDVLSKVKDAKSANYWKTTLKAMTDREKKITEDLQKEDKLDLNESAELQEEFSGDTLAKQFEALAIVAPATTADDIWRRLREHGPSTNRGAACRW